ncbi:unnamed protein product [Cuscuta campestris]|uniref:Uncharacterized protein n=1 Tax=Cuscuta campestris TaxID=132261 RepID=A0A484LFH9_9ASTE|nr:unnamed protein product [Cuscuta campestris]
MHFAKRAVAPPRILPERYPEQKCYDTLDAHLHQPGLWSFNFKSWKDINPALVRAFYSNLRREGLVIEELGITELVRHHRTCSASHRSSHHSLGYSGKLTAYLHNHPNPQVLEAIILWYGSNTTILCEDLKVIHTIMHMAPINWAKLVMLYMTDAATITNDRILPYAFLITEILKWAQVAVSHGPITRPTKLWTIHDQTFKKRSETSAPATHQPTAPSRSTLASITDSINRLSLTVEGMGSTIEQIDAAVQRRGYAMQAYFDRINYVPPKHQSTFLGQDYAGYDTNESYTLSSSPNDDELDEELEGDPIGWILSTITDEVSVLVLSSVSTTSALWTVIHDLFHDNKHARAMPLEHQFRTTVKGSTPMATYCQEFRNIADWLDDVDAPVSEHQLILQKLRGLPDDLHAQTSFLKFQDPMPSFLQVRSALLLLDRQQTPLGGTNSTVLLAGRDTGSFAGGQHGGGGSRGAPHGGSGGHSLGSNFGDGSSYGQRVGCGRGQGRDNDNWGCDRGCQTAVRDNDH